MWYSPLEGGIFVDHGFFFTLAILLLRHVESWETGYPMKREQSSNNSDLKAANLHSPSFFVVVYEGVGPIWLQCSTSDWKWPPSKLSVTYEEHSKFPRQTSITCLDLEIEFEECRRFGDPSPKVGHYICCAIGVENEDININSIYGV